MDTARPSLVEVEMEAEQEVEARLEQGRTLPSPPRLQVLSERPVGQRRAPAPVRLEPPASLPPPTAATASALTPSGISIAQTDQRAARVAAALGTFDAIARVLSIRVILLLSVVGAFALAVLARDLVGGSIFAGFSVLVVIPLIWLDHTTRRPSSPGG
jgi:hypothetical protein